MVLGRMLAFNTLLSAICALSAISCLPRTTKIEGKLSKLFEIHATLGVLITMKQGTSDSLKYISSQPFNSRAERINAVAKELKAISAHSQQSIHEFLKAESVQFQSFWISNQIYIPKATLPLVKRLAKYTNVSKISEDGTSYIIEPKIAGIFHVPNNSVSETQWGISKIMADRVWKSSRTTGQGIVVGIIDTGVHGTHQDLKNNFRSPYGWKDPAESDIKDIPHDLHGHGTHCTGIMVGSNGIGVAPGAKWMACKGCSSGSCMYSDLLVCGQWMLCPTLPDGSQEDCSKAPHLVSNSWAGRQGDPFYNDVIEAWKAAGIIPIFGLGNAGPVCDTSRAPADSSLDVFGVGATTSGDSLASFSSRGPSFNGNLKPDIAAPGESIYSSFKGADNAYAIMSGTSMATPHLSGAVALILSKNGNLTYAELKQILFTGADTTELVSCDQRCGDIDPSIYPNNCYGHGRLNVFNAISSM